MLNFASKMNLKRSDKYISPSNLIIYHTLKKMIKNKNKKKKKTENLYQINKIKSSGLTLKWKLSGPAFFRSGLG